MDLCGHDSYIALVWWTWWRLYSCFPTPNPQHFKDTPPGPEDLTITSLYMSLCVCVVRVCLCDTRTEGRRTYRKETWRVPRRKLPLQQSSSSLSGWLPAVFDRFLHFCFSSVKLFTSSPVCAGFAFLASMFTHFTHRVSGSRDSFTLGFSWDSCVLRVRSLKMESRSSQLAGVEYQQQAPGNGKWKKT